MRALIVFESMFGNTREVAEQIANGLQPQFDVSIVRVCDVREQMVSDADVVIVGGPTHMHGLTNRRSRELAQSMTRRRDQGLELEPNAVVTGLREWLNGLAQRHKKLAATFDTRAGGPSLLTGRASRSISHRLRRHGFHVVATNSFVIDSNGRLAVGELSRAQKWGETVAAVASASTATPPTKAAA
jgi:hypothetical protein